MNSQGSSIARKLITYIVLFSSFTTLMATGAQLYRGFQKDVHDVDLQLESIANTQINALSASLWAIDTDQVEIQMIGMVNFSNISYVRLHSDEFQFKYGEPLVERSISKYYDLVYSFQNKSIKLGKLLVQADLSNAYNDVFDRFLMVLVSNAIKTFLVSFFMYWLFNHFVTRPIGRLTNQVLKEFSDLPISDEPQNAHPNEIERAVDQVNTVIHQLRRLNQEMKHFCYTLSHDLKSPIVTIIGFCEMAKLNLNEENMPAAKRDLRYIEKSGNKMLVLIQDVLHLLRFGQSPLRMEPVDLNDLIEQALLLTHGTIRANKLDVTIKGHLPIVTGDKTFLIKVFQNLIENAAKFSKHSNHPSLEIGVTSDENSYLYFKDNGKGIEPQFHEKIFGLFNVLEPSPDSTGLGLTIVHQIISNHHWKVWVESEGKDKGSTFFIDYNASEENQLPKSKKKKSA